MAIYHLTIKHVQRSKGRSACAAAAYRAGAALWDARQGIRWDYRRRRADVVSSEIVLPPGINAAWARDRQSLWSLCESHDKRKNARTATELEIALPFELADEQRAHLVRGFCEQIARTYRVAIDAAVHRPAVAGADRVGQLEIEEQESVGAGHDPRNWHCHLLMTTLTIAEAGPGEKVRLFPEKPDVMAVRKLWEDHCNQALATAGLGVRVDSRSLKSQGQLGTPTRHLGPAVIAMEAKGIRTERGDIWLATKAEQRGQRATLSALVQSAPPPPPLPSPGASSREPESLDHSIGARKAAERRRTDLQHRAEDVRKRINHIHHYDHDFWARRQRWKSKLLRDQLNGNLPLGLELQIAWLRRREENLHGELIAKLRGGARVRDAGDAVFVQGRFDERAIALAIAMVKAHSWKVIRVSGSVAFRQAISAAAERESILVYGAGLGVSESGRPIPITRS